MKFTAPLFEGHFLKRYKRFFAEVKLAEAEVVAHVPNTGSMKGCLEGGSLCRVTYVDDPKRKLKYTLQMIKTPTSWVGVNTGLSNNLVWEAFTEKLIPHWKRWSCGQKEVKISRESRIDLVLWKSGPKAPPPDQRLKMTDFEHSLFHFVEIKNVTLADHKTALFPDAKTTRGQKHLRELMNLIKKGHSAELVFTVQREDCDQFAPAEDIDPEYAKLLRQAAAMGLTVTAFPCRMTTEGIILQGQKPLAIQL